MCSNCESDGFKLFYSGEVEWAIFYLWVAGVVKILPWG